MLLIQCVQQVLSKAAGPLAGGWAGASIGFPGSPAFGPPRGLFPPLVSPGIYIWGLLSLHLLAALSGSEYQLSLSTPDHSLCSLCLHFLILYLEIYTTHQDT